MKLQVCLVPSGLPRRGISSPAHSLALRESGFSVGREPVRWRSDVTPPTPRIIQDRARVRGQILASKGQKPTVLFGGVQQTISKANCPSQYKNQHEKLKSPSSGLSSFFDYVISLNRVVCVLA